jgi:tetratricopeptide (TPR) repeat protein
MQTFKLFVSSPADVMVERRRVDNVVSRLNGEFADVARLEAICWETDLYQAYSTFQAQIPRSTDCDLVIGILKWRLGSELPPDFGEKLPDSRPFPSGTAYEILTAIEKRQKGGTFPDIYVFRFGSSPAPELEDESRERIVHDWQILKGFFEEWFVTERGHFKAAFNLYKSEDDFEAQLEKLLRKWVAEKVAGGRAARWQIDVKGSPFRGLAAFGTKHASVFFGRSADTARAVELWRDAGSRGSPYLLIVGASGSGKSSVVRAAVIPRLTTPGVIKEVDLWRVAVMRPGDSAGPFAALARALMQDEASLPKEEDGRGPALPEIGQGDYGTPAELTAVLHHADAAAVRPILGALSRIGEREQKRKNYGREVRCDLVVLIDQFEELFAPSVNETERAGFIDLIAAMVKTGRTWITVTLRADFYARMLDQPTLKKLKERGATYDLAYPGPVELAETVREPVEAAGLVFETDTATGERLDARLLREADRPDMLPLVQLALSRLFEGRVSVGDKIVLPLKVYEGVGGLKGIINEAGETALASLGESEKGRLPHLLRQLAVPVNDGGKILGSALTIRSVPMAEAVPDEVGRKLVDALVAARLLTTSGADAQVRLAHQRVLEDWGRARTIVAESADFYRIRADIEESRRKWEAGKHRSELLLPRGLPLAEAENVVNRYREDLTPGVIDYVRASRKRANRNQRIGWAAAGIFAAVAIMAGIGFWLANQERGRAVQALAATTDMANAIAFEIGQDTRLRALPPDLLGGIIDRAISGYNRVIEIKPDYADARIGLGATYANKGDLDKAMIEFNHAILLDPTAAAYYNRGRTYSEKGDLGRAIADYDQAITLNPKHQSAYVMRGKAYFDKDDLDHAIADFDQAIDLFPDVVGPYVNRGNAYSKKGDLDRAIADYDRAITLDPKTAIAYFNRGNAYRDKGNHDRAIADYDQAITLDPKDVRPYFNRGLAYGRTGDLDRAIADYDRAITLDPKDVVTYVGRGNAYRDRGDLDRAIVDYDRAITLDPKTAIAYVNRGSAYGRKGDLGRAIVDYDRAITLDPKDAVAYVGRGLAYSKKGDHDRAIADYDRAITLDPKDAGAHFNRGIAYSDKGNHDRAIADYDQAITLDPKDLRTYFNRGIAYGRKGDLDRAIADYDQAIMLAPSPKDAAIPYYYRGIAYRRKGDLDRAIADYDRAITLNPKYPGAYISRGIAYRAKGDLDHAIADYSQAITLDPMVASFYRHRALAYFFAGFLPQALVDLDRSSELDATNSYTAIWLDIVGRRSNLRSRLTQASAQIDMTKWPAPVISLFLGQLTSAELLAVANDADADTKKGQVCEANFYIGELLLQQGKADDAIPLFQFAAKDCPISFDERAAAKAELKALGKAP